MNAPSNPTVRHFREVLFWPVQLAPLTSGSGGHSHWEILQQCVDGNPWRRLEDRFRPSEAEFEERHYKEFVAFLPHVQRFLHGTGRRLPPVVGDATRGGSAIKIFRRSGVSALRLIRHEGDAPVTLNVEHIELWFFEDINVAFLKLELSARDISLTDVCGLLYRFGRAYPTGWDRAGHGKHNVFRAEWLDAQGQVLVTSDSNNKQKFLDYTQAHRSPGITAHWDYLLRPLVLDASEEIGELRYSQLEYHRMPLMAFVAVDKPRDMSRENWLRLGLVATLHPDESVPADSPDVARFEERYCYDRYWTNTDRGPNTRFICTGRSFIVVGDARSDYFHNAEGGILAQFRHQYVLLFLIAHFHRASLLIFSDRMVDAIHGLDIRIPLSVVQFRRRIYAGFEAFLRFTHRYWFHEVSERSHVQALFRMTCDHLGNEVLYQEVKEELSDMSQYLDSNTQRQQSTTVVRLTVVTVFSMIGTVATGILGMNLIAEAEAPVSVRVFYFVVTTLITALFMLFAILKSRQLSDVMDVLADDQKTLFARLAALSRAWKNDLR